MAQFLLHHKDMFTNYNVKVSLLSLGLEFEFKQLSSAFEFYKNIFDPILKLEKYDKLGIEDTQEFIEKQNKYINYKDITYKIYLDKYKIYQSVSRWYWNQKRILIFPKIDKLFDEYKKIIMKIELMNNNYGKEFEKLFEDCYNFNKQLLEKLYILKSTYNDIDINNSIDNYCLILTPQPDQPIVN